MMLLSLSSLPNPKGLSFSFSVSLALLLFPLPESRKGCSLLLFGCLFLSLIGAITDPVSHEAQRKERERQKTRDYIPFGIGEEKKERELRVQLRVLVIATHCSRIPLISLNMRFRKTVSITVSKDHRPRHFCRDTMSP